ncbi:MAG: TPM domain-containing protein [Rickettsiales bacterium]|nr:TPM domain-containing protein [Rickettsiales bacterium]
MTSNRIFFYQFLLTTFLFIAFLNSSEAKLTIPQAPKSFILDQEHLINEDTKKEILEIVTSLYREKRVPIVIVTIPSMAYYGAQSYGIEKYARLIFDQWGLGSKDFNYGILLLISKGDRKARIEFGAQWNNEYNNEAHHIMQKLIIRNFKIYNYSNGIYMGVKGLDSLVRGVKLPGFFIDIPGWALVSFFIVVIMLVVFVIISLFRSGRSGWGWMLLALLFSILVIFLISLKSAATKPYSGGSGGGGGSTGSW